MRITERDLNILVNKLNSLVGINEDVKYNTVGAFEISHAYGGVSLHRILCKHGSVEDVFRCGHIPKKDLYYRINAFLNGIEFKKDANND